MTVTVCVCVCVCVCVLALALSLSLLCVCVLVCTHMLCTCTHFLTNTLHAILRKKTTDRTYMYVHGSGTGMKQSVFLNCTIPMFVYV